MPSFSVHPDQLADSTKAKLNDRAYFYANSNAGMGWTDRANREAFYHWRIVPRMLVDTNARDMTSTFTRLLPSALTNVAQRSCSGTRCPRRSFSRRSGSTSFTRPRASSYLQRSRASLASRTVSRRPARSRSRPSPLRMTLAERSGTRVIEYGATAVRTGSQTAPRDPGSFSCTWATTMRL